MQYRSSFPTCRHALLFLSLCITGATLTGGCSLLDSGSDTATADNEQNSMSIESVRAFLRERGFSPISISRAIFSFIRLPGWSWECGRLIIC